MERERAMYLEEKTARVREKILAAEENLSRQQAMEIIEDVVFADAEEIGLSELHAVIRTLYARTRSKLGILEEYIEDASINEIMINGKDRFFLETCLYIVCNE